MDDFHREQTVEVLQLAKSRGLKPLAITDTLISPLAHHASHVLTARCKIDSFIESFVAPLSLINAVVTALGIRDRKTTLASLRELEDVWRRQETYYLPLEKKNEGQRSKFQERR